MQDWRPLCLRRVLISLCACLGYAKVRSPRISAQKTPCLCVCAVAGDNSAIARSRNMYGRLNNEAQSDETSPDGSKTETSDILAAAAIPDSYGSTPAQDKTAHRFYVPFCGLIFYVMTFFGYFCSFALRETLSVAIVAMVNQSTLTEMDIAMTNASDQDECARDSELELEGGEFNWDRNEEGIVLSAFYYGYIVTQVRGIKT